ncbi:MAG: rhodanese-like domain-containing protein [Ketobacteraceae bacterium]|nr:rhodanese-like domain-containing protein [Ketobacteraceae bacterium]
MQAIDRNELQASLKTNPDMVLIEVLDESEFEKYHLPYSMNVPLDSHFEDNITAAVPDKDKTVVVYCKNESCDASEKAAKRIEELGYSKVYDYTGGKEDWKDAGLPIASREEMRH